MPTPTRYQRVGNATVTPSDYALVDDNGVPFSLFLRFDGVDDGMQTNSINFTSTDKMTVWAGVNTVVAASSGTVVALTATPWATSGGFRVYTNTGATGAAFAASFMSEMRGSSAVARAFVSTKNKSVITTKFDGAVSGVANEVVFRQDGVDITGATSGTDSGLSAFSSAVMYVGRTSTLNPFNGRLHSLIVRGAQSTDQQIEQTEAYVNARTKAFA
jgi:hypothetical protein